jgi:peptide/nickel transport system permease protein
MTIAGSRDLAPKQAGDVDGETFLDVSPTDRARLIRRLFAQRGPAVSLGFIALLIGMATAVPIVGIDPNAIDLDNKLVGPSWDHWLGTDHIGRDVLSRLAAASRVSLYAGAVAMLGALALGLPFGLVSGYFGGMLDSVLSRIVDGLMALPGLFLVLVVVQIMRPGLSSAMMGIAIAYSPLFFRVVRGATLAVRHEVFIEAARVSMVSTSRILRRHVVPNIAGPLVVQAALTMSQAIIAEASISFLGLGVQVPQSSWGSMLKQAAGSMNTAPLSVLLSPSVMLVFAVLSFNSIADGLQRAISTNERPAW